MQNSVRIFIHIVDINQIYECYFSKNSSISDNLKIFFQLIENSEIERIFQNIDTVMSEDYSICLDTTVSMQALNVVDGMLFHIC